MLRRNGCDAVVYRQTAESLKIRTIHGTLEHPKLPCNSCNQLKPIINWYVESEPKRKHNNHMRKQCIGCWDMYNGKHPSKCTPPTNDLTDFFIMENENVR
jgi:hypothetical protein